MKMINVAAIVTVGATAFLCGQGSSAETDSMPGDHPYQRVVPVAVTRLKADPIPTVDAEAVIRLMAIQRSSSDSMRYRHSETVEVHGGGLQPINQAGTSEFQESPSTPSQRFKKEDRVVATEGRADGPCSDEQIPTSLHANRLNYFDPTTLQTDYPYATPFRLASGTDARVGQNDYTFGLNINQNVGSGFSTFLGKAYGNNNNYQGVTLRVTNRGSNQGGGIWSTTATSNGTDDLVYQTAVVLGTGTDRGDNEGSPENRRLFFGFQHGLFGGLVTLSTTDDVGHQQMRIASRDHYNSSLSGGNRVLIDLTKKVSPEGNVTSVGRSKDSRFAVITVDSTMQHALAARFGTTSFETTLLAGADGQRYDGSCPSLITASSWGTHTETVDGVPQAVKIDPYNDNFATGGSRTKAMCITVRSTKGLQAGRLVGIFGAGSNWEYELVTRVVDDTHVLLPLDHPHDPGEVITSGAGLGWALSTPRNDYPAGYLSDIASAQPMTHHTAYPVMRINGDQVELYTNSAGTQNQAELHLNLYQSLVPAAPLRFAATATDGSLSRVTGTSTVGQYGDYSTSDPNLPGTLGVLPPPTLNISDCTIAPRVKLANVTNSSYVPIILAAGAGCAPHPTVTVTSNYINPVVLYPATRINHVEDPNYPCLADGVYEQHCPTSGYLVTSPIAVSAWANGDTVEQVPHWNQFLGDQLNTFGSQDVLRSTNQGPASYIVHKYPQPNEPIEYHVNVTPDWMYFGRSVNNYSRVVTQDPTQVQDGTLQGPVLLRLGNTFYGAAWLDRIPMLGLGTKTGGYLFRVSCLVTAQDGPHQDPACARGNRPDYDLVWHDQSGVGGADIHLTISEINNCLKWNGKCLVTRDSTGTLVVGGATTPTNGGIVLNSGTNIDSYTAECSGVISGSWCITTYHGAPAFIGSDGGIYIPTLTRVGTAPGRR